MQNYSMVFIGVRKGARTKRGRKHSVSVTARNEIEAVCSLRNDYLIIRELEVFAGVI